MFVELTNVRREFDSNRLPHIIEGPIYINTASVSFVRAEINPVLDTQTQLKLSDGYMVHLRESAEEVLKMLENKGRVKK